MLIEDLEHQFNQIKSDLNKNEIHNDIIQDNKSMYKLEYKLQGRNAQKIVLNKADKK